MLVMYHGIAERLTKVKGLVWLCLILTSLMCVYTILFLPQSYTSDQEMAFFVLPVWFLSMVVLMKLFAGQLVRPAVGAGLFVRLRFFVKSLFNSVVALVFSVVTLVMFYLSVKAILFSV